MNKDKMKKHLAKCHRCKYDWETESKAVYVSCPSCMTKVKIREILK